MSINTNSIPSAEIFQQGPICVLFGKKHWDWKKKTKLDYIGPRDEVGIVGQEVGLHCSLQGLSCAIYLLRLSVCAIFLIFYTYASRT